MSVNGAKMPRLGSARLGSARLGSARLGSSIAPFIECVKFQFHHIVRKNPETGCTMPCFRIFLLWEGGALLKLYA